MSLLLMFALSTFTFQGADAKVRPPPLPRTHWLNTNGPLQFGQDLRGRIVILSFWSCGSVHCSHVLADLARLEERFKAQPVVLIGVHSARFPHEGVVRNVRAAVQRCDVGHPVIIDVDQKIGAAFGITSTPAVVVVDPQGFVFETLTGDNLTARLYPIVDELLQSNRKRGTLADRALPRHVAKRIPSASHLAFPTHVLADAVGNRLFIADSNHNRIVISTLPDDAGRAAVIRVVGDGAAGAKNGPAESATFHRPGGLALFGETLLVADTWNHLIRTIDLKTFEVATFAGTGERRSDSSGGQAAARQAISSPEALEVSGKRLYVAMAGTDQIWEFDLDSRIGRPLVGSGREELLDGPADQAGLAQPSGLALVGRTLYFCDAQTSAVRALDIEKGEVHTVVGHNRLDFGDVDGPAAKARLQYCTGIAASADSLLISDTYNHKLKWLDLKARTVQSFPGHPKPGDPGSPLILNEPRGLCLAGDRMFVADTNNHRIVAINRGAALGWAEVMISGLDPPRLEERETNVRVIKAPSVPLKFGAPIELVLSPRFPSRMLLDPDAPLFIRVMGADGTVLVQESRVAASIPARVTVPTGKGSDRGPWQVDLTTGYAERGIDAPSRPLAMRWIVPINRVPAGPLSVQLTGSALKR